MIPGDPYFTVLRFVPSAAPPSIHRQTVRLIAVLVKDSRRSSSPAKGTIESARRVQALNQSSRNGDLAGELGAAVS